MIRIMLLAFLVISGLGKSPEYDINLDLAPGQRYIEVLKDQGKHLEDIGKHILNDIPPSTKAFLEHVYRKITRVQFPELAEELRGIAKLTKLTEVELFIVNMIYEIRAQCTSVVARQADGVIIMGRTLDFIYAEKFRVAHVNLNYISKGKTILRCGSFAGAAGFFTCMRPGKYSMSLNLRPMRNKIDTFKQLLMGRPPIIFMIRSALLRAETFEDAKSLLESSKSVSGGYITLAGITPKEGAVITRARDGAIDTQTLSDSVWYIRQCNRDHWEAHDTRSKFVTEKMNEIGPEKISMNLLKSQVILVNPIMHAPTIVAYFFIPATSYWEDVIPDISMLSSETYDFDI